MLRSVVLKGIVRFYVVALLIFSQAELVVSEKNYCSLDDHHTMCMYKTTSTLCVKYTAIQDEKTIEKIVKSHNKARSKYASGHSGVFVSDMLKMYWDQELADISSRWSCQCKSRQDSFRDVDRFEVAQVVWSQQDSQKSHNWTEFWDNILKSDFSGFNERDYKENMISDSDTLNLLKIIYNPKVKYLGCTLAQYQVWVETVQELVFKTTLVCNYGPHDRIPQEPAVEDWPCRACPPDHPCFTEYYVTQNVIPENLPDERNLCIDPKLENLKPQPGKPCKPSKSHIKLESMRGSVNETNAEFERLNDIEAERVSQRWDPSVDHAVDVQPAVENTFARGEPINYCKIVCRNGEEHTMCKYREGKFEDEDLDGTTNDNETEETTDRTQQPITTVEITETETLPDLPTITILKRRKGKSFRPKSRKKRNEEIEHLDGKYRTEPMQKNEIPLEKHKIDQRELKQRIKLKINYTTVEPDKRTKIPPVIETRPPTTLNPEFPNGRRCRNFLSMTNTMVIDDLLLLHNQYRNDFAEGIVGLPHYLPGNMLVMKWDESLQKIAERWISQCYLGHDKCRDSVFEDPWSGSLRVFEVGQNIGWRRFENEAEAPSHRDIFNDWLNASESFPGRSRNGILEFEHSNGSMCNYAQIIWASTYLIGCAYSVYEDTISRVAVLACNYAPIGCSRGKPLYIPGGPCSLCDTDSVFEFSRCIGVFPNLCSLEWEPNKGLVESHSPPNLPLVAEYSSIIALHVINCIGIMNYVSVTNPSLWSEFGCQGQQVRP